jgi:hypothetical protein
MTWTPCRYTFDTTLGVSLAIMLHRFLLRWAKRWLQQRAPDPEAATGEHVGIIYSIAMCGDYGGANLARLPSAEVLLRSCRYIRRPAWLRCVN